MWELQPALGGGAGTGSNSSSGGPAVRTLQHHKEAVVAAAWSQDSCQLVTADKSGGMAYWPLS